MTTMGSAPPPFERLASISISADGLSASLLLSPHGGRAPVVSDLVARVTEMARARGVTVPVEPRAIQNAFATWSKRGQRHEAVIARGQKPVAGQDAVVTLRRPKPKDEIGATAWDRVGKRNQGRVLNVEKGAVLATVTPARAGVPGSSVTGDPIPAEPGRPAEIEVSALVAVEEAEGTRTYRAMETAILVELSAHRIDVARSIEIAGSVDRQTGNLDVWGSVTIKGSVLDGFSVRALGDVTVAGTCESAYIEAGGDVSVGGGILGRSGITIVKCKGNCAARFVENATVEVGGAMMVADFVLQSRILAGSIDVRGRGTVLASHLAAEQSVNATAYGSDARLPVEIVVGSHPLEWRTLLRLKRELRFVRRATLAGADHGRAKSDVHARMAADRKASRRRAAEVMEGVLRRRRDTVLASLMAEGGPGIHAKKAVFPRTRIRLGPYSLEVEQPLGAGTFRIDPEEGRIIFEPD